MVHGLDRGCPAIPRHPHERYQVCYQEGKRQRSAGIFPTRRRALAEKRAIERGRDELVKDYEVDLERARTLFGDYVATNSNMATSGSGRSQHDHPKPPISHSAEPAT
jgi:hypothetical protein